MSELVEGTSARERSGAQVTVGAMLIAIAALHQGVGVAIGLGLDPSVAFAGPPPLTAMLAAGLYDSVGMDAWRNANAWFLLFGFGLALIGMLSHQVERAGFQVPVSFALAFAALCALGIVLMPVSGFWLGFIPALVAYRRATR